MFWRWTGKTARAPQPGDVLQADARGVPAWARTTGEIAALHGVPKTPGFPHYLDGLPMSVVSQLGYIDRGIGKRGIFAVVDDFLGAYRFNATVGNAPTNGESAGLMGPYLAAQTGTSYVTNAGYSAGAIYVYAQADGDSEEHKGILFGTAKGVFSFATSRRLWFSARVRTDNTSGAFSTSWAALGVGSGLTPAGVGSVRIDQYLTADLGVAGAYFYKEKGDADWSFALVEYAGEAPTVTRVPALVQAIGRAAPSNAEWLPLAFTVVDGAVTVYVDGLVAAHLPATNPQLVQLLTEDAAALDAGSRTAFIASMQGIGSDGTVGLDVDSWLVAEETGPDPD